MSHQNTYLFVYLDKTLSFFLVSFVYVHIYIYRERQKKKSEKITFYTRYTSGKNNYTYIFFI